MNPLELNKEPEVVKNDNQQVVDANVENQNVVAEDATVIVEAKLPEVSVESTEPQAAIKPDYNLRTKSELIDALTQLINQDVNSIREEVEAIKQSFYKKLKAENEEQKIAFVESGGLESDFISVKNEFEDDFKALLNEYRSKKASLNAQIERERENNLLQKQHVLEQMKLLVESNDDVSMHINDFRTLQQKWKSIGQVPASAATDLWKQYNLNQESFWDLVKINNELRDYDFKKNLESKTAICEAAELLDAEPDVITAFQNLQKLHDEWHELGPVSRELRDVIWGRFKDASSVINKKHQAYFDTIRKMEDENMEAKTALCEKVEAFDFSGLTNYKAWDDSTQTVLAWQDEWRSIGFAPRKVNQKLFERYRKACDAFFAAKAEFYKESKTILNNNLDKKKELCEKAEALKDSVEWKETADKLIQLQKEWKTVGPVAKKYSDELWKRFIAACDAFFEQKNKNSSSQRSVETDNLAKKKELIQNIIALAANTNANDALAKLRELMNVWNGIGHVPFKEKDKIYKEYREAVDKQFEILNVDASQRRLDNFKSNLKDMSAKGENKMYREREKLMRAYEHLKSEIATYENNIGFFTSSSKKGGGLIKEMERKIEALKDEQKLIEQKIGLLEESL